MSILTSAQATRVCRITDAVLSADKQAIQADMIAALNGALEPFAGPVEQAARTWTFSSYGLQTLILPWPYSSITSIVGDGATIAPSLYDAVSQASSGVIIPALSYTPPWAYKYVTTVTAVVGNNPVPPNLVFAAELLIQSWWQDYYSSGGPASQAVPWTPPSGDLPVGVRQAIGTDFAMPGFA